jgi:hypothetical protein
VAIGNLEEEEGLYTLGEAIEENVSLDVLEIEGRRFEACDKTGKFWQLDWRDLRVKDTWAGALYLLPASSLHFHLTELNVRGFLASYVETAERAGMLLPARLQNNFKKSQPRKSGG